MPVVEHSAPFGLAHNVKLVRPVKEAIALTYGDIAMDTATAAYRLRKAMANP